MVCIINTADKACKMTSAHTQEAIVNSVVFLKGRAVASRIIDHVSRGIEHHKTASRMMEMLS
jgi:hypothetical protein